MSLRGIFMSAMLVSGAAGAQCESNDKINPAEPWSGFTRLVAEYSVDKNSEKAIFEFVKTDGELLFKVNSSTTDISILAINGVGILYKNIGVTGIKSAEHCYQHTGDTYAYVQSYGARALYLIGIGSQTTPDYLVGRHHINYVKKSGESRMQLNPGDHLNIGAPWFLNGSIERKSDVVAYEIHHKHTVEDQLAEMFVTGTWSNKPQDNGIAPDALLDDWLVCLAGKSEFSNGERIFTPYITDTSDLSTVGQLRALAR